jgi:hypothetical protein
MAAAAAVIVTAIGIHNLGQAPLRFPEAPILRGSAGGPILYPRGHVLLPSAELKALFPTLGQSVAYQIEPQAEASEYTFVFTRHDGGAFGHEVPVKTETGSQTSGMAPIPLSVGAYTLTLWAKVNGLDQRLAARDFDVRVDPKLESELLALASQSETERVMSAITMLHTRGYVNDARNLARTMPASPERDRFLGQIPGR